MRSGVRLSIAGLAVGAVGAALAWVVYDMSVRPVAEVNVTGAFRHASRVDLEAAVSAKVGHGFFGVDVDAIREAAKSVPWVRKVRVRRVWPHSLEIEVEERDAIARWGADELIESDGSKFRPRDVAGLARLPHLSGPVESETRVLAALHRLGELTTTLPGGRVERLRLSARGDWYAALASGVELVLDREPGSGLLARIAPSMTRILGGRMAEVERIDMRYGYGFAVRWRETGESGGGQS